MWNRRALTGEQQKLDILPAVGFAVHWNPNNFVSSSLNGGENEFVYGDLVLELPFISLVGWIVLIRFYLRRTALTVRIHCARGL